MRKTMAEVFHLRRLVPRIYKLTANSDRRAGRTHEVFAPAGYQFPGGHHSVICYGAADLVTAKLTAWEKCPADCTCGEEA